MANKTPDISIRGIRQSIPSGYLIGRSKKGDGQPHLIPMTNIKGTPGAPGAPGQGVPTGGTTGQVLTKNSATDYDTGWATPSGGGGGGGANPFWASAPTVPTSSSFTLVKGAGTTAAISDTTRGVLMDVTGAGATDRNALLSAGAPPGGGAWTMTALLVPNFSSRSYMSFGLYVKDGAGKIEAPSLAGNASGRPSTRRLKWTNITTYSSSVDVAQEVPFTPVWVKLQLASSVLTFSMSCDGENFGVLDSFSVSDFVSTITDVGVWFGVNQNYGAGSGNHEYLHVMSFALA